MHSLEIPAPADMTIVVAVDCLIDLAGRADLKVVALSSAGGPPAVISNIEESGLGPADFKADIGIMFGEDVPVPEALSIYSALVGFGHKWLPVFIGSATRLPADRLIAAARSTGERLVRPDSPLDQLQISSEPHPEVPSVAFTARATTEELTSIRYARRVRFAPDDELVGAFAQFLAVAGLRVRGRTERFPWLVSGDEPTGDLSDLDAVVGVCLDSLRREGSTLRAASLAAGRTAMLEALEPSERQLRLSGGALVSMRAVMEALGAKFNDQLEMWHCPRPRRHRNGDHNPSMRVYEDQTTRCFRCDGERVDALRLAVDVTGMSPDEASKWTQAVSAKAAASEMEALFA